MRWPRRRRPKAGRLPSLGQDYVDGHLRYVERLEPARKLWLRTKPFSAPPGYELLECFRTFAHIVDRLGLDIRAQVLDVGCGPGWLSEFLARCGYWVTGVDVAEEMVAIARERIARIGPIGEGVEAVAEFHTMPVVELPWRERFDAAVLYDAMHHFDDEIATLRAIRRTLVQGGRIFIHEGVRPAQGSEGERFLIAEMERYGTLESPFDPDYLVAVLREAGFTQVTRLAAVDDLLELSEPASALQRVEARMKDPPMNTLIAVNPIGAGSSPDGSAFVAELKPLGSWRRSNQDLALSIVVRNAGRSYWPASVGQVGAVTLGPFVTNPNGEKVELPRTPLPQSLSSGDTVDAEVQVPITSVEGRREVAIDLVREGIAWFSDYGSPPLIVRLPDGT